MADLGIVGLDTSHADSFAGILADRSDVAVTAVWDGGDVRDDAYARQFCDRYGTRLYDSPTDMIGEVDAALVLAVDWNRHRDLAVPFLEADVPTLIDKPVAGRLDDLQDLREAAGDTPLYGGSAIAHDPEFEALAGKSRDRTVHCVGYNDPFYYGCHLADSLRTIAGDDWASVTPAEDPGQTVDVAFEDGTFGTLRLDDPDGTDQFAFVSTGTEPQVVRVTSEKAELHELYRSYLDGFLKAVQGRTDTTQQVLDAASLLLAIDAALEHDRTVTPSSELLAEHAVASDAFVNGYPSKTYVSWEPQHS